MEFHEKYQHVGISRPGLPKGWEPIVKKAIIIIEPAMWPQWIPFPVKRIIHWLANGNSVFFIKYRWANRLRDYLTHSQMITDIKEKYATLRIYGYFGKEVNDIIKTAEIECSNTCQRCGSHEDVKVMGTGWYYNVCGNCSTDLR